MPRTECVCGSVEEPSSKFCSQCGASLLAPAAPAPAPAAAPAPAPAPVAAPAPAPVAAPASTVVTHGFDYQADVAPAQREAERLARFMDRSHAGPTGAGLSSEEAARRAEERRRREEEAAKRRATQEKVEARLRAHASAEQKRAADQTGKTITDTILDQIM